MSNRNQVRQEFLMTFFENYEGYEEKKVNGFWLVKSLNGKTGIWHVAIYTESSFNAYKRYGKNYL